MDNSKEYIKMCEKAEEIQMVWLKHNTLGDFAIPAKTISDYQGFWTLQAGQVYIVGNDNEYDLTIDSEYDLAETGAIWLPRQDQLQEMIASYPEHWIGFLNWSNIPYPITIYEHQKQQPYPFWHFKSMEQLWLAFVMKEKYCKIWSDEQWIRQ